MRFGFALPQIGAVAGPEAIAAIAQRAGALGYDSLWVLDRLLADQATGALSSGRRLAAGTVQARAGPGGDVDVCRCTHA